MPKILKVRIDNISLTEATETVIQWAQGPVQRYLTTVNPEILLSARENRKFKHVLNKSDLNTPDGIGILWAAKFLQLAQNGKMVWGKWLASLASVPIFPRFVRSEIRERVTGVDLMQNVCKKAPSGVLKIFLLGAGPGVAEKTKEILEKKYKTIEVVDTFAGSPKEKNEKEIRQKIITSKANTLFVAFGAPKQELWISRNLKKMPNIMVAVGVGGSFDFISGIRKRSPLWMQKIGLEWLYRLLLQPARIIRIFNATVRFPLAVLKSTKR